MPALQDPSQKEAREPLPTIVLRATNVLGWCILIAVNILAGTGALGSDNATISRRFATPITPAGWAFSIWGIIFSLQGAAVVYQALPWGYQSTWKKLLVNTIGYSWQAGWYLECAWQVAFFQESRPGMWVALVCMLGALAAFSTCLRRLHAVVASSPLRIDPSLYALYVLPTSINTAWLSLASCLATLIVLDTYHFSQAVLQWPAVALALAASAAGLAVLIRRRDGWYGLTLVWGLVAICGAHPKQPLIRGFGLACLTVVGLFTILALTRRADVVLDEAAGEDEEHVNQPLLAKGDSQTLV